MSAAASIRQAATQAADQNRGVNGTSRSASALWSAEVAFAMREGRQPTDEERTDLATWTSVALAD